MRWFEYALWNSRYIVLIPIVACVLVALLLIGIVTTEAIQLPAQLVAFVDGTVDATARADLYRKGVTSIAKIIDGYLFATIMLIFAMGLYELFIGKIAVAEKDEVAKHILLIRGVDDFKDRLAKIVFLILIVTYFEYALSSAYQSPLDVLMLAGGIALVGGALWLANKAQH